MKGFRFLEPLATVVTAAATGLGVVIHIWPLNSKAREGCRGNPRDGKRGLFKEAVFVVTAARPQEPI